MRTFLAFIFALFAVTAAHAQPVPRVRAAEEDGSPRVTVGTIKFPNGSLTDNGDGTVSYSGAAGNVLADNNGAGSTVSWVSDALGKYLSLTTNFTSEVPGQYGLEINTGSLISLGTNHFDADSDGNQLLLRGFTDASMMLVGTNEGGHVTLVRHHAHDAGSLARSWQQTMLSSGGSYYFRHVTGTNANVALNESDATAGKVNSAYYDMGRNGEQLWHGPAPFLELEDTDAAANGKRLRFFSSGTSSGIQFANDAFTQNHIPFLITRGTGTNAVSMAYRADAHSFEGGAVTVPALVLAQWNAGTTAGAGTLSLVNTTNLVGATFSGSTATISLPGSPTHNIRIVGTNTYNSGSQILTFSSSLVWFGRGYSGTTLTNASAADGRFIVDLVASGGNWVGAVATGDNWSPTAVNVAKTDTDWMYFDAGAMTPRTTSPAASATFELPTNDVMLDLFDFDAATDEFVQFRFQLPDDYVAGTDIGITVRWTAASGSGDVIWNATSQSFAEGDAMDAAFPAVDAVTDTLTTANDMHVATAMTGVSPGGTPAAGEICFVQISRDADNGSDTLGVDARLIGVLVEYDNTP